MNALECIERISATKLIDSDLQYCFMDSNKLPFQINHTSARSNDASTFVPFDSLLLCDDVERYQSVAISVQASKICAVDIDHCLSKQNDFDSISALGRDIVDMFKEFGYVESSFSGYGIRILFRQPCIPDYKEKYYLKNSKIGVEYYQWDQPGRYVSVTGNCVIDNSVESYDHTEEIEAFLEKYMKRAITLRQNVGDVVKDDRPIEELFKKVKFRYLTNTSFQDLWFDKAPGHGSNESERDYKLVAELYENVTQDPDKILELFKMSTFYKTKDREHLWKFNREDNKYFKYLFENIRRK